MEISFQGKRVLVTGAGRGVGRELVKRLVKYGAVVVALSKTEENLLSLKTECPSITTVTCDVGHWEETKAAVENVCPVDMLVNNAALLQPFISFGDIVEEDFDRFMAVNVKGALNIAQVVSNSMKSHGIEGSIVNVSSILSTRAVAGKTTYAVTKAALDQMTRVMAVELGPHKIRVNSVNPGIIWTDRPRTRQLKENADERKKIESMVPLRRFSEPAEVVDAIIYLLSDKASMVHGTTLMVDGGAVL